MTLRRRSICSKSLLLLGLLLVVLQVSPGNCQPTEPQQQTTGFFQVTSMATNFPTAPPQPTTNTAPPQPTSGTAPTQSTFPTGTQEGEGTVASGTAPGTMATTTMQPPPSSSSSLTQSQETDPPPVPQLVLIQAPPASVALLRGDRVLLPCQVGGFTIPPTYAWRRNGANVDSSVDNAYNVLANGSMILWAREAQLGGTFECVAMSNDGPGVGDLITPPSTVFIAAIDNAFVTSPADITVGYGQTAHMNCTIRSTPVAAITWFRNDISLGDLSIANVTVVAVGTTSYLRVSPAKYTDEASRWYCRAVNANSPLRAINSSVGVLSVRGRPVFLTRPTAPASLHLGDTITLSCQASANPPAVIAWTRPPLNTLVTANTARLTVTSTGLRLTNVMSSDAGQWACSATNSFGTNTIRVQLSVLPPSNAPRITTAPLSQAVGVGGTVALRCQANGNPPPAISWQKDSLAFDLTSAGVQWIPATGTLTQTSVQAGTAGTYRCLATNAHGSAFATATVTVETLAAIRPALSNRTLVAGATLTVTCTSVPSTGVSTRWWHNGVLVGTLPTLVVTTTTTADTGRYECEKTNTAGTTRSHLYVTVQERPSFVRQPADVTIQQGSSASLSCQASGVPPPSVVWVQGSQSVRNSQHISVGGDDTLAITNADTTTSGVYQCVASNVAGTARASANVIVIGRLLFTRYPSDVTVISGNRATLVCSASAQNGKIAYTWYYPNSTRITAGGSIAVQVSGGTLTLSPVTYSQRGRYTCRAQVTGSAILKDAAAQVIVLVPPVITSPPVNSNTTNGSTAILRCSATGIPVPTVAWQRNGSPIRPTVQRNFQIDAVGTLTVSMATKPTAEGNYICTASSSAGTVVARATLRVLEPPVITSANVTVIAGEATQLPCVVQAGDPRPITSWRYGNGTALPSARFSVSSSSSLVVASAVAQDEGYFVCTASNGLRTVSVSAFLQVLVRPTASIVAQLPAEMPSGQVLAPISTNVSMRCQVAGKPPPTVIWGVRTPLDIVPQQISNTSDRLILGASSDTLMLLNVQRTTAGDILCRALNSAGSAVTRYLAVVIQEPPDPPSGFGQISQTSSSVEISWRITSARNSPITNTSLAYAAGTSSSFSLPVYIAGAVTRFNVSGLFAYTSYRFRVSFINSVGASQPGTSAMFLTCSDVPSMPQSLQALTVNASALNVTWEVPAMLNGPLAHYEIRRSLALNSSLQSVVTTSDTFLAVSGLRVFTEYAFTVRAVITQSCGTTQDVPGASTAAIRARTLALPPTGAPRNVTVVSRAEGTLLVVWLAPLPQDTNGQLTTFRIYFRRTGATLSGYETAVAAANRANEDGLFSYPLSRVEPGAAYDIKVQAVNSAGGGPNSTVIPAETLALTAEGSTSVGKISGIVVGCVCGLLVILAIVLLVRNHLSSKDKEPRKGIYDVDTEGSSLETYGKKSAGAPRNNSKGSSNNGRQTSSRHETDAYQGNGDDDDVDDGDDENSGDQVPLAKSSSHRTNQPVHIPQAPRSPPPMQERTATIEQTSQPPVDNDRYTSQHNDSGRYYAGEEEEEDQEDQEGETRFDGYEDTEENGGQELYSMPQKSSSVRHHHANTADESYFDENEDADHGPAVQAGSALKAQLLRDDYDEEDGYGDDSNALASQQQHQYQQQQKQQQRQQQQQQQQQQSMYEDPSESALPHRSSAAPPHSARAAEEEHRRKAQLEQEKKRKEEEFREWKQLQDKQTAEADRRAKKSDKEERKGAEKAAKEARKQVERDEKERRKQLERDEKERHKQAASAASRSSGWNDDFATGRPGQAVASKKAKKKGKSSAAAGSSHYSPSSSSMMMY